MFSKYNYLFNHAMSMLEDSKKRKPTKQVPYVLSKKEADELMELMQKKVSICAKKASDATTANDTKAFEKYSTGMLAYKDAMQVIACFLYRRGRNNYDLPSKFR